MDYVAAIFGQKCGANPVYSVRGFFIIFGLVHSGIRCTIYDNIVAVFFEEICNGVFICYVKATMVLIVRFRRESHF
ncbi:hypothetical protein SDC9_82210 [bioreactor metagenome]|uniref:Uncharacterized protein n=1 Tax=bioreactor metagenome TaxID=1076179 RepID=A0A644Z4S8_9ZZZZ